MHDIQRTFNQPQPQEIRMTATEATYEHHFVMADKDADGNKITFGVIEDESGDIYWGYGHVLPDEFTAEVNRWFVHTGSVTDPDDLVQVGTPVEHLWATLDDEHGERFTLVDPQEIAEAFPVTRLML
jgi:hypothetical protein